MDRLKLLVEVEEWGFRGMREEFSPHTSQRTTSLGASVHGTDDGRCSMKGGVLQN
jgi:hypothetical protein